MSDPTPDQVAELVAASVVRFELAIDTLLAEFQASWDSLTREDWRTLRRALLEQFRACVPLRSTADPRLRQLVTDALFILSDDDCKLSRLDWRQRARTILQESEEKIS